MAKQYKLTKGGLQDRFMQSRSKIQFIGGGFGNGKTTGAIAKTLIIAKDYPGANILVARSTYPKLNDTIRKAILDEWCPKDWVKRRPVKDDNTLILKNGTVINFRYVAQRGKTSEDGSTTSNLLSANYDLVVVDQIEDPEIGYKDFTDLMGRMRGGARYIGDDPTMPSSGPRWMILTANPSMNWVYQKLVKPVYLYQKTGHVSDDLIVDPLTKEPWVELFEGSTYENKHNLDADYIRGLEATYKGQQRERYLMGGWAAYEGLIYNLFSEQIHVIPHKQMIEYLKDRAAELRRHFYASLQPRAGYDYGLSSPACYIQSAVDPEYGIEYLYDGFYERECRIEDQADYIAGLQLEHRGIHTGLLHQSRSDFVYPPVYADPQIFKRVSDRGTPISRMFADYGITMFKGSNNIATGLAKNTELLGIDEYLQNPFTGKDGSPRVFVSDKLQWFIDEIGAYYWKRDPHGNYVEEPNDRNDHAMDTWKYLNTNLPKIEELRARGRYKSYINKWRESETGAALGDNRHG